MDEVIESELNKVIRKHPKGKYIIAFCSFNYTLKAFVPFYLVPLPELPDKHEVRRNAIKAMNTELFELFHGEEVHAMVYNYDKHIESYYML